MPSPYQTATPPDRSAVAPARNFYTCQAAILHARDAEDRRRIMLAAAVMCMGVLVAGVALWQARNTRTVYAMTPGEPAPLRTVVTTAPVTSAPATYTAPVAEHAFDGAPPTRPRPAAAPAMPLTWTPPPAFAAPTPVDYAARDRRIADLKRQMEEIDEIIRGVRVDPHWYGIVKRSTDTSRQQASDTYLAELDRRRNDLRRQKWALEGR